MIVIERDGRTTVITGWRARLLSALVFAGVTLALILLAFVALGIAITVGMVLLIAVPIAVGVAIVASALRRRPR